MNLYMIRYVSFYNHKKGEMDKELRIITIPFSSEDREKPYTFTKKKQACIVLDKMKAKENAL